MFSHKITSAPLSTSEVHPTPGALPTSQHLCSSREFTWSVQLSWSSTITPKNLVWWVMLISSLLIKLKKEYFFTQNLRKGGLYSFHYHVPKYDCAMCIHFCLWAHLMGCWHLLVPIVSSTHPGTACRWHLHMQVKTLTNSLLVLSKLAYFDSATTEQLLIISPLNFVPVKKSPVFMSYWNSVRWGGGGGGGGGILEPYVCGLRGVPGYGTRPPALPSAHKWPAPSCLLTGWLSALPRPTLLGGSDRPSTKGPDHTQRVYEV